MLVIAILSTLYTGGQVLRQVHELFTGKQVIQQPTSALLDIFGDQVCFCMQYFTSYLFDESWLKYNYILKNKVLKNYT